MKVTIDIDCTPQEARTFLGLPDVEALNGVMVDAMKERVAQNLHQMQPEEMMKTWSSFGTQAQEHFLKLMQTAATSAMGGTKTP
jgi:hypothetical protein